MLKEIMAYFGFKRTFKQAGYFEIEHHERLFEVLKVAIQAGKLIVFCGIVSYGKLTSLRPIQKGLQNAKRIIVYQVLRNWPIIQLSPYSPYS